MFVRRNPARAAIGARRVWPWAVLAAALLLAGCDSAERCSANADCAAGEVCSNEKNPLGDGVCISPCTLHPNTPACPIDAGPVDASVAIDAGVDAAPAANGATP